jgi:hypothetical protein
MEIVFGAEGTGDWGTSTVRAGAIKAVVTAAGEIALTFSASTGGTDGYSNEILRIAGAGVVSVTGRAYVSGTIGVGVPAPTRKVEILSAEDWPLMVTGQKDGTGATGGVFIGSRAANKGTIQGHDGNAPADLLLQTEGGALETWGALIRQNNTYSQWRDSIGTAINALGLDGSNNFHVGPQVAPASAGDTFFYARGDDAFKLTKPTANFYLEPIDDYLVHLGTVSKRFEVLNTMFVQVYSNVATGRAARLDLQTGDEANTLSLLAAQVGGGTYSIYFPAAPPGAANRILVTGAGPTYGLAWGDIGVGGSGTVGTIPKFSAASTLSTSAISRS